MTSSTDQYQNPYEYFREVQDLSGKTKIRDFIEIDNKSANKVFHNLRGVTGIEHETAHALLYCMLRALENDILKLNYEPNSFFRDQIEFYDELTGRIQNYTNFLNGELKEVGSMKHRNAIQFPLSYPKLAQNIKKILEREPLADVSGLLPELGTKEFQRLLVQVGTRNGPKNRVDRTNKKAFVYILEEVTEGKTLQQILDTTIDEVINSINEVIKSPKGKYKWPIKSLIIRLQMLENRIGNEF